jgi:RHS repeat-associated protein
MIGIEIFTYDNLNRLSAVNYYLNDVHVTSADKTISYNNYGNIVGKSGLADSIFYGENGYGPHAVTSVWNTGTYSPLNQSISYTAFDKAETITDTLSDGTLRKMQYVYGLDQQRRESIYTEGSTTKTKYYFGDYEEVSDGTSTQKYFYIDAPTGLAGIYVIDGSGTGVLNYTFNDHLGSITEVINTSAGLITYQSFDAWGNAMSSTSWTSMAKYTLFIDRCFYRPQLVPIYLKTTTGTRFEKYVERSEIPIAESVSGNGRMYDPVLGRFLSPDPFVQMPDFSQNFNRYSYCLNNPLKYTDPSGELFFVDDIIIGAVIGAMINVATQTMSGNINSFGKFWSSAGIGALAGAAGAGVGQAAAGTLGFGGFYGGCIIGGSGGAAGGAILGSGNAWANGANFGDGLLSGFKGSLTGSFTGAFFWGGVTRGLSDLIKGYSFWDGIKTDPIYTGLSPNEQLANNYNNSTLAETNDDVLKLKMSKDFNVEEGDYAIRKITTQTSRGFGMTTRGNYVEIRTGSGVGGYCRSSTAGWSEIHISPYNTCLADNVTFRATAGHELIHSYHYFILHNVSEIFTERVAYKYTYDVYMNNGYYGAALKTFQIASNNLFWGYSTPQYTLPFEVLRYLP